MLNRIIKFFLENRLITVLLTLLLIIWGIATAPFNWDTIFPADPVAVDAIPDLGENQQIVFTEWKGRSPQDIEDQITYPLSSALLGIPGVKTIRSNSMFGVSSIYLIFEEGVEFYWSRSRILEKLSSLPNGTLPEGVKPALGPDATSLGQIYWYTLEGRDSLGNPTGGWDPHELRTIQDFYVKYGLASAGGVAEVASIGGFVKEYQVDIDPIAMKSYEVNIQQIMAAVKKSNLDAGARTIEFNRAEYLVRGLGYVENIEDLEQAVVVERDNLPIRVRDVAKVQLGPATRRGGLDNGGSEAVGAVVVARYGSNPMEVIENLKDKIEEIKPGLPSKLLEDGRTSRVTIVPFYDRSGLIQETLGTLEEALSLEVLISILVVIILILNLRASLLISSLLPVGVLITFIAMRYLEVSANIVALSGIAIAIGVMVDVGVVFTENIVRHLKMDENQGIKGPERLKVILRATQEVGSAVLTALATTIISFIPVFALQAQEGKLFQPLAFTKTFALVAALIVAVVIIPTLAYYLFSFRSGSGNKPKVAGVLLVGVGVALLFIQFWFGLLLIVAGVNQLISNRWFSTETVRKINIGLAALAVITILTRHWMPLGVGNNLATNLLFVALLLGIILIVLIGIVRYYEPLLRWCLENKGKFLVLPVFLILFGLVSWIGFPRVFSWSDSLAKTVGWSLDETSIWNNVAEKFPGLGNEFMPPLDEGSFLLMPTNMPHSGVEENISTIQLLDQRVNSIPEVEQTVGKWGRVDSALDPAPISMFENVVNYKSEYILNENGARMRFKVDENGDFELSNGSTFSYDEDGLAQFDTALLIEDSDGDYFRQWRGHIKSSDDIWNEIVTMTNIPGLTSAPKLQPIATRLVMLSTGMRAPMGIKVFGPDLETIEKVGLQLEALIKNIPGVKPTSVFADRVVGKPYFEIEIDRMAIGRYGLSVEDMQTYLSVAIGGTTLSSTVEGRERYGIRVRYARELRNNPEDIGNILIPTPSGIQIPLSELASFNYSRGPQNIKSEDTFLVSYVIFDKEEGLAETDVVLNVKKQLEEYIENGVLILPAGTKYTFAGNYENQIRANKRLSILIPLSLILILVILYFQFGNISSAMMVFSGVFVAFAGGFILIWLYGQSWFLDFSFLGSNIRELFQVAPINLSVAIWVGFIALFGIASDNGVLMATYLKQSFDSNAATTKQTIREATVQAGLLRIRPAMMTTATTLIALLPIFTSTGKGSDIMVPMAIPTFGGMLIQVVTVFIVPVLYCMWKEFKLKTSKS